MLNLIDVGWFVLFVGSGMLGGGRIASFIWSTNIRWLGVIIGGISGYGFLLSISLLEKWQLNQHPACHCGRRKTEDFVWIDDEHCGHVEQCQCRRKYVMRKGRLWYEVFPDAPPKLRMKRGFWGKWKAHGFHESA